MFSSRNCKRERRQQQQQQQQRKQTFIDGGNRDPFGDRTFRCGGQIRNDGFGHPRHKFRCENSHISIANLVNQREHRGSDEEPRRLRGVHRGITTVDLRKVHGIDERDHRRRGRRKDLEGKWDHFESFKE